MGSVNFLPRKLLILGLVLPLAVAIGYLMATPDEVDSFILVGLIVSCLMAPLFLRWYHPMAVLFWNASMTLFFLPGQPHLWMVFSVLGLGIAVLERGLTKREVFTFIPSIVWALASLGLVILVTAQIRGGLGLRSMGGNSYGAKRYFFLLAAILGYFVLTSRRIPLKSARVLAGGFFASALTAMMSNIIYLLGPAFYFLYAVFPVDLALSQAFTEFYGGGGISRLVGFAFSGPALINLLLISYGIRGIFSLAHPFRFALFLFGFGLALLGGFRSSILMTAILFCIQFYLEGLHRTRIVIYGGVILVLAACFLVPMAKTLPLSVQRSLSFLPLDVDPIAKVDAQDSTEWRLDMWQRVIPDIPRYLLLGKGCSLDPTELYFLNQGIKQGFYKSYEEFIFLGSYHNGPLTLLIQFGLPGTIAFLWFAFASCGTLYRYYRVGSPELKHVNTFLFAYFLMKLTFFLVFYGHFSEDFFIFTGIIGLAVSLNGNFKKAAPEQEDAKPASLGVRPRSLEASLAG
jgi:hypothetical protein